MPTKRCSCRQLLAQLGLLGLAMGFPAQPALAQGTTGMENQVQTPKRGQIAAFFVADGDYVQRGQLLVKLESPTGSAFYVSAPRSGRIQFVRPTPGGNLAAHTRFATIQSPVPAVRLAHRR